jgi:hypothetical protein
MAACAAFLASGTGLPPVYLARKARNLRDDEEKLSDLAFLALNCRSIARPSSGALGSRTSKAG